MFRPIGWWAGVVLVLAFYYLYRHFLAFDSANPLVALDWAWFKLWGGESDPPIACRSGIGDPLAAAVYLAIHKGSIVAGLGGSEKLEQVYACLYGTFGGERQFPVIPHAVVYAGLLQTLFSAAMVFFFLLAMRNHFRIK